MGALGPAGALSTSLPAEHRKAPCQGGAGAATSVLPPQGPGVLLGSKTGAVLELALLRLCHPVHHPGLAVGPTVAGDGAHSSFIFTCPPTPLPGGGIKSLGMTVTESPGGGGDLIRFLRPVEQRLL